MLDIGIGIDFRICDGTNLGLEAAGLPISVKTRVDCMRRETGSKGSYERTFNRLLDKNMGRASNVTGVGGLLFIPSTNLEPRMDASAKGADRPHFGIRPPHTSHSSIATCNPWTHWQICRQ